MCEIRMLRWTRSCKQRLPLPLQNYSGLRAAPLAEAEQPVGASSSLAEEEAGAALQLPIALQQSCICLPHVLNGRGVKGRVRRQSADKTLELICSKEQMDQLTQTAGLKIQLLLKRQM